MEKKEKPQKESQTNPSAKLFKKLEEKYREHLLDEIQQGKEHLMNFEKTIHKKIDTDGRHYAESLKSHSIKIRQNGIDSTKNIQKNSPKIFKKIKNGFFEFFQLFVGNIKLGTQYGASSLDLLERVAKLKELGIISEKDFLESKKKLLKRI